MLNRERVQERFRVIPNRETVKVRLKSGGQTQEVNVIDCWRKPAKFERLLIAGLSVSGNEEYWHIPDLRLNPAANGRQIKQGDEIVTTDTPPVTYTVQFSQLQTLRTVWRCLCGLQK